MTDVFISYKKEDKARCQHIADKLRRLGLKVWFDVEGLDSGREFDREIEAELKKTKAVLVLWSKKSVESRWVRAEAKRGQDRDVLLAAQLEPCELPIQFEHTHFETLHEDAFDDDHPGWLRVLARLGPLVGRPGLEGLSRALAQAGAPLLRWADMNQSDPMAASAKAMARGLAGSAPEPAPKAGASPAVLAVVALAAAAVAGGAAWTLKPAGADSAASEEQIGQPAAVAPASPEAVAAGLLGDWGPVSNNVPDCAPGNLLTLALTGGGLSVAGQVEPLIASPAPGSVTTQAQDGTSFTYERQGDRLFIVLPDGAGRLEYGACES